MSNQQPGTRRRRIAGERRRGDGVDTTPVAETRTSPIVQAPSVGEPPAAEPAVADPAVEAPPREASAVEAPSRGWWGGRASLIALSLALVVLVTFTVLRAVGVLGGDGFPGLTEADAVAQAQREAPAAAERAAGVILAYDHRTLDEDQAAAEALMLPEFASQYAETFEKVVRPSAAQVQAVVTAEVQASAVVRATQDRVRVLLFIDQTTQSTANEEPQVALNRVEMVMVRSGGEWLVEEITSY